MSDSLIASLPNPLFVKDNNGRFVRANDAMGKLSGCSSDELIGRTDDDFVPAQQAQGFRAVDRQVLATGSPYEIEEHHTGRDGIQRTVVTHKWCIFATGGERFVAGLITDVTDLRRAQDHIYHMATHDPLTDLLTRAAFRERLEVELSECVRYGRELALLYIDLDRFKRINDEHGHAVGDAVLKEVAAHLRATLRERDIAARIGGDEFLLMLTEADPAQAMHVARRLTRLPTGPWAPAPSSASIGIARFPHDATNADELVRAADVALYRAKAQGRGRACTFWES